ncbi:MAG: hypothetical protein ACRDHD_12300, partial [Candidatus Limnocylindria bacterium]
QLPGRPADADGLVPVSLREPARLLAWRRDGREEVLAVAVGTDGLPRACCLTIWRVGLAGSGQVELELLGDLQLSAEWIRAVDLDGDGTDEVVLLEPATASRADSRDIRVLRWEGTFRVSPNLNLAARSDPRLVLLGDSDGLPGDEVGVIPGRLDARSAELSRLAMATDGSVTVERTALPFAGDVVPLRGSNGGRLVLASDDDGTALLRWPSGAARAVVERTSARQGRPVMVLGSGTAARLVLDRGAGVVDLLDPTLMARQRVAGGPAASRFRLSSRQPYVGPLPGGLAGADASFIVRGRVVSVTGGRVDGQPIAALPGMEPVGLFGPEMGWAAIVSGAGVAADRTGGRLAPAEAIAADPIGVVPAGELLAPEVDGGLLAPLLTGAVTTGAQVGREMLLSAGEVSATVAGPRGTRVLVDDGDQGGPAERLIGDAGEVTLAFDGPGDGEAQRFTARLVAISPSGHGYGVLWDVRVRREPPRLRAEAALVSLSFDVEITGSTEPDVALSVDGRTVQAGTDGGFNAAVPAGLLPRTVRLEATDAVGNRATATVEVVAVLDYRRLPWIPIVVVVTVVAAAILYLRAPRPSAVASTSDDVGTVEEIE